MLNICFMGNPKFALQTLDVLYNEKNINIKLVVSSKDKKRSRNKFAPTEVKKYAIDHDIMVESPDSVNTKEFVNHLKELEIDFIVVVAYGQLIKKDLLEAFDDRIINLHPSLLPKYRGPSPIQFALLNGDKKTAATAMLIEKGMDSGDILIQTPYEIDDNEDYFDLEEKLGHIGALAIRDSILNFDQVYKDRIVQDDDKATYCTKISKDMGKIDFNNDSNTIINQIRAFVGFPVAFFDYKGQSVKVHKAHSIDKYKANPGKILKANKNDGIIIATKDSAIEITKIQFPGKKAMDTKNFLLGNDLEVGYIIGNE